LEARWKRNEGKIEAELDIPPNCSCEIVSAGSVQELRNGSFRLVCPVGENQVWTTT
jgi:hypothetical protein